MRNNQAMIETNVKRLAAAKYSQALVAYEDGRINEAAALASDAVYFVPTSIKYIEFSERLQSLLERHKVLA